ncbi:hypothetical protein AUK40_00300 [Candidatus Wirthbacteria bacterium CG2_30_54_11]|uniref:Mannose-6-phosphate isomerase n=1 Tax=Candidatus Wirthbacteria bacterium CG2_30_54_11 TaxID=1817892 RepID=A0A1J5ITG2_9BACT|nr:MAG: hypothetical protein AUK40_00300 [Candidatus Wirthbacteria bacterium CG2_30_54_11]
MLDKDLYLIVPILIEQPTWGGSYIPKLKGITREPLLSGIRIGQSYELAGVSRVIPCSQFFAMSRPDEQGSYVAPPVYEVHLRRSRESQLSDTAIPSLPLHDLLVQHPIEILGKSIARRFGTSMPALIKYTQALGNSFQLHVKETEESTTHWLSKPETWFFLEPGSITLGVKPGCNWQAYEKACREIATGMELLSKHAMKGSLTPVQARGEADRMVLAHNPWQFVNCLRVDSGTIIDPSAGGIHHSWEEDANCPLGNILYEVQRDRSDSVSTIRSFDKGKFNPDGSVRSVQIDDYFKYIDRSEDANSPKNLMGQAQLIRKDTGGRVSKLFETAYYRSDMIFLSDRMAPWLEHTDESFHHIFVKEGAIQIGIEGSDKTVGVREGWSVFVPAQVGAYHLRGHGGTKAEVIKTYIPKS